MFAFRLHHLHGVSQAYKDSVAVRVWDETFKIVGLDSFISFCFVRS